MQRTRLLPAPESKQSQLQQLLNEIGDQDMLSTRLSEAAYLGNLLSAGVTLSGKRLTHRQSVDCVMATCNLGLEYAERAGSSTDLDSARPGLVRLFQVGWRLLQVLPVSVARDLQKALESPSMREKVGMRTWMLEELITDFGRSTLITDIELKSFDKIADSLTMLRMLFVDEFCDAMKTTIDSVPRTADGFIQSIETLSKAAGMATNADVYIKPPGKPKT
ncbi:MAG: hypothetical protein AAF525_17230 [Pseudomonadota bacterium]